MTAGRRDWHWWAALAARLILAGVLIAAAAPKILDPYAFSFQIRAYEILGERMSRWMAVALPWIELTAGLLLLAGVWLNAASALAGGMMIMFSIAIASALSRGLKIECGCFGADHSDPVGWPLFWRDIGLLILCAYLFIYSLREGRLKAAQKNSGLNQDDNQQSELDSSGAPR